MHDLVIDSKDVSGFLSELCEFSAKSFSSSMGMEVVCAVTLHRHRRLNTAAWSSLDARRFDEIQHGFGEGPWLHAMETQTTVLVRDARTDPRWPDYGLAIAALGQLSGHGRPWQGLLRAQQKTPGCGRRTGELIRRRTGDHALRLVAAFDS